MLSFGINDDYTFDQAIESKYKCRMHSFDPFVEAELFKSFRKQNPSYSGAYKLPITRNWNFYRMGVVGDEKQVKSKNQIGWMATLTDILELTMLVNETVDILKMDIEGGEA